MTDDEGKGTMNTDAMAMVTLKDGTEVPLPLCRVVMIALRSLCREDPIGLYELTMAVRDPNHRFFGTYQQRLTDRRLLDSRGRPAGGLNDVVRNAVEGDGLEMHIVDPEQHR